MAITRSSLGRGPAYVGWNNATFFTRDDLVPKHSPVWEPVKCSLHGQIDKAKKDLAIKIPLTLYGIWDNVSVLFPAALKNPTVGTSLFGTSDLPLTINARNGDKVTYFNAQLTKLSDLYLGADGELFAAQCEFTALLANNKNPEDASAYFVRDTGQSYAESTFANTKFYRERFAAAWTGKTAFTTIAAEKGWHIAWTLDLKPQFIADLGTVDMYIGEGGLIGGAKCIPIGPTMAQLDTAQALGGGTTASPATGSAHGTLLSAGQADLTIASTHISVALKYAGLTDSGNAFGIDPLRIGEVAWETTRGFSSGTAQAVTVIS